MAKKPHPLTPETLTANVRLGAAIRDARVRRRLTQAQLADRVGCGKVTIGRLEAGDPGVSVGTALEVLATLQREWLEDVVSIPEQDQQGRKLERLRLPERVINREAEF